MIRELSEEAKQVIVDKHNELRRKIAKGEESRGVGGGQPAAANMRELRWNDELATIAQRWTDQCTWGHDKDRRKLDGTWVGQNAFAAGSNKEETREQVVNLVNIYHINSYHFFDIKVESRFGNAITAFYNEVRFWPSAQISPFKYGVKMELEFQLCNLGGCPKQAITLKWFGQILRRLDVVSTIFQ